MRHLPMQRYMCSVFGGAMAIPVPLPVLLEFLVHLGLLVVKLGRVDGVPILILFIVPSLLIMDIEGCSCVLQLLLFL